MREKGEKNTLSVVFGKDCIHALCTTGVLTYNTLLSLHEACICTSQYTKTIFPKKDVYV